ncbi:hypothetical protein BaRGS_00007316 [Batillaria attramentaria]|uniref:PLAT domain-containing protein n=1 Tax=Batillaria attramentaria TaxID=370345 RepID=A0ABD0LPY5_9CAEN
MAVSYVCTGGSACYGDLGCFSNDAPFFSLYRPLSLLPQSPQTINPKFTLYTREDATRGRLLHAGDVTSLNSSTFNPNRPTKFVVHGFIDNGVLATWMKEMKDEFLRQGDYNVVLVDWGHGSLALYGQATANTRVVGAMIAQLINFMKDTTGARPEDMHVLGHSLGSHVAGYAGERVRYLGRITGLDPAEPYFQNTDKAVRLDPTDALFVDVIHSDGASFYSTKLGLGMSQACGHVDYYPNGGHDQPGCEKGPVQHLAENGLYEGTREFVACNHMRSYHLFIDSINSHCPFEGYRCSSEDEFNAGNCMPCSGEGCGYMGMHADRVKPANRRSTNKYFLKTGDHSHYCRYHYKVAVTFAHPTGSKQERGKVYLQLTGTSGQTQQISVNDDYVYISPGQTYTYILTSATQLGEVQSVTFKWDHDSTLLNVGSWNVLGLRHPKLYLDRIQILNGESRATSTLCAHGVGVETDHSQVIGTVC